MSGKQFKDPTKMTVDDLDDSNSIGKNNKYAYSAFSTAPHKDHVENTNQKTHDRSRFRKSQAAISAIDKYKISLNLFEKQNVPKFKQTMFQIPDLEHESLNDSMEKQNNINRWNKQQKETVYDHFETSLESKIPWKSATKAQTAEIVRNLFSGKKADLNFEYRKKKFFQNFAVKH